MVTNKIDKGYAYRLRSCMNCNKRRCCSMTDWINSPVSHSDFGKSGCVNYEGKYQGEKIYRKKPKGRARKWDKSEESMVNL